MLRFFLLLTFSGKTGQKFAREVLKLAFQKCGRRPPPIVLLVEIHKSEIFKLIFMSVFLHIIVELGEKYALKHFFNHFEAKLTLRNQKSKKCGSRPPPLCYPLVVRNAKN